jgi:hypothetical protein
MWFRYREKDLLVFRFGSEDRSNNAANPVPCRSVGKAKLSSFVPFFAALLEKTSLHLSYADICFGWKAYMLYPLIEARIEKSAKRLGQIKERIEIPHEIFCFGAFQIQRVVEDLIHSTEDFVKKILRKHFTTLGIYFSSIRNR